jgi:hypothetical protein
MGTKKVSQYHVSCIKFGDELLVMGSSSAENNIKNCDFSI